MNDKNYRKNVFNEMRMVIVAPFKRELTDENIVKAVTANEEIGNLGLIMSAKDVANLAKSVSVDTFPKDVAELVPEVKAKPMYPDFPKQVMDIDEAEYRFHWLVHTFSTYGMEALFGVNVKRGWLPDMPETEKTEKDNALIDKKVIKLLAEDDMWIVPLRRVLEKTERMTIPETEIVKEAIKHLSAEELADLDVTFKENLKLLFFELISYENTDERARNLAALRALCQHTGDVWKCVYSYMASKRYKLSTAQKRFIVDLLESFPVYDFEENLYHSKSHGMKVIPMLQYLSYNSYSKSNAHKKAVKDLRDGNLVSWYGKMEALLQDKDEHALEFISKRPGLMFRMIGRLVKIGYSTEMIEKYLLPVAKNLNARTVLTTLQYFGSENVEVEKPYAEKVYDVMYALLGEKLKSLETPLAGKKVFLDSGMLDLDHSIMEFNERSQEGGYFRSGLAIAIPEDVKYVRFFVYWNDKDRVDIDLHTYWFDKENRSHHIGWNGGFCDSGVVFSGDIQHSDAAEYIDVDLSSDTVDKVTASINSYTEQPFKDIETVFVGMMGVSKIREDVQLYDPKNCFFSHELKSNETYMQYGYIDVPDRCLRFVGQASDRSEYVFGKAVAKTRRTKFSLGEYIKLLCEQQDAVFVDDREEADVVLTIERGKDDEISLLDEDYFL